GCFLELFETDRLGLLERADACAPECRHMAETAERAANIAGNGTDVCAAATFGLEHRGIGRRHLDELQAVDLHRARFELHLFALPREIIGPLAIDLDGGKRRRCLKDLAEEARQ